MKRTINIFVLAFCLFSLLSMNNFVFAVDDNKFGIYGFYLGQTLDDAINHAKNEGWQVGDRYDEKTIASSGALFLKDFFTFNVSDSQVRPFEIKEAMSLFSGRVVQKLSNDNIKYSFIKLRVNIGNPRVWIMLNFYTENNSNSVPKMYYIDIDSKSLNSSTRDKFYDDVKNIMKERYGKFNYNNKYQEGWSNGNYYILNQIKGNSLPYFIDKKIYEEYLKYYIDLNNKMEQQAKSKM